MFKFKQKDSEFFDLFVESAQYFYQGALMMDEVMLDYSKAADKVKEVVDLEHAADAVNDKIIDKLNLTFITPIDREDIYALANGLDDGVDNLQGTLQRIVMYRTGKAMSGAVTLTKLLIESTEEIIRAFSLLKNIRKNQAQILEATHKIGRPRVKATASTAMRSPTSSTKKKIRSNHQVEGHPRESREYARPLREDRGYAPRSGNEVCLNSSS